MFDRKVVTKTYKFIFIDRSACEGEGYSYLKEAGAVYTFGNRDPRKLTKWDKKRGSTKYFQKYSVADFFTPSVNLAGEDPKHFLPSNILATEANITKAMMEKWAYEIEVVKDTISRRKTDITKLKKLAKGSSTVRLDSNVSVDISVVETSLQRDEEKLAAYKSHLKEWRGRYKDLEQKGVYMWAALSD